MEKRWLVKTILRIASAEAKSFPMSSSTGLTNVIEREIGFRKFAGSS